MLTTTDSLQGEKHTQTKNEGMEKIYHENWNDKKVRIAVHISN